MSGEVVVRKMRDAIHYALWLMELAVCEILIGLTNAYELLPAWITG